MNGSATGTDDATGMGEYGKEKGMKFGRRGSKDVMESDAFDNERVVGEFDVGRDGCGFWKV